MSGFTVSGLVDFVKETSDDILRAAILEMDTLKAGISIQAGIKDTEKLLLFANTAPFQVGGTCAFNASGSSTFTNVSIAVSPLKWNDTWCPEDIQAKFIGQSLAPGSNYDTLPFEQLIMDTVTRNISAQLEQTLWQGDTTDVGTTYLKHFDGLLKKIDAGSPISATTTAAVTTSNVIAIFDDIYFKIPAQLLNNTEKPMVAFTGWDNFRKLLIALKDANNFHFDASNAATTGEYTMPGSGLKVKAVNGLNNIAGGSASYDDRIICTYPTNLYYGTDLANEFEEAKVWYSQDDQNIKGSIKWKSGTQVAYITEVVEYSNT